MTRWLTDEDAELVLEELMERDDLLSAAEVSEAERLSEKATPGPWRFYENVAGPGVTVRRAGPYGEFETCLTISKMPKADCKYIAASREGWPKSLATIRALEEALRALVKTEPVVKGLEYHTWPYLECAYCGEQEKSQPGQSWEDLSVGHKADCSYVRARDLLERRGVEL